MASYSYQSSSYSSGGADGAFQQADANSDGRIDLNEFRNFLGAGAGGSSFESASFESSGAGFAGGYDASFAAGAGADAGASSFESASFSSSAGFGGDAAYAAGGAAGASYAAADAGASSVQVQQYATDAQGFFQDPNPQIIRRAAVGGGQTYTQNIKIRFLQPPPPPPPGPLIIKEVRPPQPPPPPPLRLRQTAPPLPTPPPLVLRERPPQPPAVIPSQTVIRRLAGVPVPPRSVIIERLPPLPPRPRDVIIERWVPYAAQAKRRTIVQRAGPAARYPQPRNVIIQYEPVQVRVVRQFQRLGVVQANPQAYYQQYGASLLDGVTLVQQARSAGVVEDISPPAVAAASSSSFGFSAASYGQEASGAAGGYGAASFESAGYSSGGAAGFGGSFGGASFESSGFSSGADAAFAAADLNQDGSIDRNEFSYFVGQGAGAGQSVYEA